MGRLDYRADAQSFLGQDPIRALRAMLTVIIVEINTVRQNPTQVYPPLTQADVLAKLKAAYRALA